MWGVWSEGWVCGVCGLKGVCVGVWSEGWVAWDVV